MRVAAAAALIGHVVMALGGALTAAAAVQLIPGATAVLLILGLWTPVIGVLAALQAGWIALAGNDPPYWLLVMAVTIALALLGPGAWSLDARLFGWKRVDFPNGNGNGSHLPPD
jgi:hypothetical protein